MSDPKLNPGSNAAIAAGCKCNRVENHYGHGANGEPRFVISGDCPLHNRVDGIGPADRMQCRNE